jgi:capsular polysaccharide biosynthesis protein
MSRDRWYSRSAMSRAVEAPEVTEEDDVEVGRLWWRIVARWWLVAAGIGLGIVIGYLASLGGGAVYEATGTVYLGTPLSPNANTQIQGLQTNPATVTQIIRSRAVVADVAAQVGVAPGQLRSGISSRGVGGVGARTSQPQLVEITVRGPWRRQSADASNLLAQTVVDRLSGYADAKIEQFTALLASQDQQLESLDSAIERYRTTLDTDPALASAERLVVVGLLNDAGQARSDLVLQRTETMLALSLAEEVEQPQIVTRAAAAKVDARSRRTSILVGAVIGLIAGVALALVWDPAMRRLRKGD